MSWGGGEGGFSPLSGPSPQGTGVGGGQRSPAQPLGRCRGLLTALTPALKNHGQAVREAGSPGPLTWSTRSTWAGGHYGPLLSLPNLGRAGTFPGPPPRAWPTPPDPLDEQQAGVGPPAHGHRELLKDCPRPRLRATTWAQHACVLFSRVSGSTPRIWQHLRNNISLIASAWLHVFP